MLAKALRTNYPSLIQVADKRSGSKGTGFSPYIKEARTMGF
jgi:hypothetical protein